MNNRAHLELLEGKSPDEVAKYDEAYDAGWHCVTEGAPWAQRYSMAELLGAGAIGRSLKGPSSVLGKRVPKTRLISSRRHVRNMHVLLARSVPSTSKDILDLLKKDKESLAGSSFVDSILASGSIPKRVSSMWKEQAETMVKAAIAPCWKTSGVAAVGEGDKKALMPKVSAQLEQWFKNRIPELAEGISKSREKAIMDLIFHYTANVPLNPNAIEKLILQFIGLTPLQAKRAIAIRDSIANPRKAESVMNAYIRDQERARARNIARTESALAFNMTSLEMTKKAVSDGDLPKNIIKTFYTMLDERVCAVCTSLHQTNVSLTEDFSGARGNFPSPPVHPSCRCVLLFETLQ